MIEIIKNAPKKYKTQCGHCDCIFLYELDDIKINGYFEKYVSCPNCKNEIKHNRRIKEPEIAIGKHIRIIYMEGEPDYSGKIGVVTQIDDIGQIHGTWGGCAIIPETDKFEIIG